ncbi:hypothetical protein FBUS_05453 [Fasciolopsis buskii]|uniref:Uncharacterized protein n=1 Tax=Fasciolopsis buskii TaxID=27845 RepID=A0A8E0VJX5_9TREM|nr:hypothetical protein FBUS_05453 [Fasciolopsis buski]
MFEPQQKIEVSSIAELNLPLVVQRAFTITPVYTQEPESDGSFKTFSLCQISNMYCSSKCSRSNAAFNQDIFIDFMAAQVKTLSFLAYVIKIYQVSSPTTAFTFSLFCYSYRRSVDENGNSRINLSIALSGQ